MPVIIPPHIREEMARRNTEAHLYCARMDRADEREFERINGAHYESRWFNVALITFLIWMLLGLFSMLFTMGDYSKESKLERSGDIEALESFQNGRKLYWKIFFLSAFIPLGSNIIAGYRRAKEYDRRRKEREDNNIEPEPPSSMDMDDYWSPGWRNRIPKKYWKDK